MSKGKGTQTGRIIDRGSNVKIKNKENRFTMVSNTLIKDPNLSLKAKGLYMLIQSYITIPNFQLYKSYLYSVCTEGERAFDAAWKELQEAGYLVMEKKRNASNHFYYEYELLDEPKNASKDGSKTPGVQNVGVENYPDPHFAGVGNVDLQKPVGGECSSILKLKEEDLETNTDKNKSIFLSDNDRENDNSLYRYEYSEDLEPVSTIEDAILSNEVLDDYTYDQLSEFVETQMNFTQYYEENPNDMASNMRLGFAENVKDLLIDMYAHEDREMRVGKTYHKTALIKPRLLKLSSDCLRSVVDDLTLNVNDVKNISVYIQTMLINAHLNQSKFSCAIKSFDE